MPNGTPAPAASAAAPTPLSVRDILKRWAVYQGLAIAAHGFALSQLQLPLWLQPWLGILWLLPIVAIIYEVWPRGAGIATKLIFGAWFIGSLVSTFPLMQREYEGAIARRDTRAFAAYQRAAVDFWLKFAATVNPDMLVARRSLFDEFQKAQDDVGNRLEGEMRSLNNEFITGAISAEEYRTKFLALTERTEEWRNASNSVRNTILGRKRSTGPFGVPFTIWALALLGLTISAKSLPDNRWVQFLIMIAGGALTMMYLGAALPEVRGWLDHAKLSGNWQMDPFTALLRMALILGAVALFVSAFWTPGGSGFKPSRIVLAVLLLLVGWWISPMLAGGPPRAKTLEQVVREQAAAQRQQGGGEIRYPMTSVPPLRPDWHGAELVERMELGGLNRVVEIQPGWEYVITIGGSPYRLMTPDRGDQLITDTDWCIAYPKKTPITLRSTGVTALEIWRKKL